MADALLQLRPEPTRPAEPARVVARRHGHRVATMDVVLDGGAAAVRIAVDDRFGLDTAASAALVDAALEMARGIGASALRVDTDDVLVRDHARLAGFTGPLRATLVADVRHDPPRRSRTMHDIGAAVGALLPGTHVSSRAAPGIRDAVDLLVDPLDGGDPLVVGIPGRDAVLVESVAAVVDTAVA